MSNEIVNYDAAWAKAAQAAADQAPPLNSQFFSTGGGILAYGEEEMPGNQACVIILAAAKENTLYEGKYNPDAPTAPVCYAFGGYGKDGYGDKAGDLDMAPHPSMQADLNYFKPQADYCGICPHNEWGSSEFGTGKSCKNKVRLTLLPAGYYSSKKDSRDFDLELYNDPTHFRKADMGFIRVPTTSVTGWWKYVSQISTQFRRPPHGVITRLFLEKHPKYQTVVHFEMVEEVPAELAQIVMARQEEASTMPMQGYQVPQEKEQPKAGSLRGLRRG